MKKSIIKKGVVLLVSVALLLVALVPVVSASIYPEDSNSYPRYPFSINFGDLISNDNIKFFVFSRRGNNWSSTPVSIHPPYLVIISAPVTVQSFDVSVHGVGSGSSFRWKGSINSFDEDLTGFSVNVVTIDCTNGQVLDSRSVNAPILDSNDVFWLINNKMRGESLFCCNSCGNSFSVDSGSSGEFLPLSDDINYTDMLSNLLSQILTLQLSVISSDQTLHDDLLSALDEDRGKLIDFLQQYYLRMEGLWLAQYKADFDSWSIWWADHIQIIEDMLRAIIASINVENTVFPPDESSSQKNKLNEEDSLLNDYNSEDFDNAFSFDPSSNSNVMSGLQFVGLQLENTFTAIPDLVVIITFSLTLGLVVLILGKKMR